jgi:hypothetical protein
MSSGQIQSKGKEFLHSAELFGGKAKGLFAKGKNKLRASGGAGGGGGASGSGKKVNEDDFFY